MSPDFFKKPNELAKEKPAFKERGQREREITPEPVEVLPEKEREYLRKEVLKEIIEGERPKRSPAPAQPSALEPSPALKSKTLAKIESILEEDLGDVYFKMNQKEQQKFKTEGEKTAAKIEKLMKKTKVSAKHVFKLILKWLKNIPGISKLFLKQEAKIKTDKILRLK
ncbi:MAG: hypothetical protein WC475_04005 [Candidatus Paceibacterota bacterium]